MKKKLAVKIAIIVIGLVALAFAYGNLLLKKEQAKLNDIEMEYGIIKTVIGHDRFDIYMYDSMSGITTGQKKEYNRRIWQFIPRPDLIFDDHQIYREGDEYGSRIFTFGDFEEALNTPDNVIYDNPWKLIIDSSKEAKGISARIIIEIKEGDETHSVFSQWLNNDFKSINWIEGVDDVYFLKEDFNSSGYPTKMLYFTTDRDRSINWIVDAIFIEINQYDGGERLEFVDFVLKDTKFKTIDGNMFGIIAHAYKGVESNLTLHISISQVDKDIVKEARQDISTNNKFAKWSNPKQNQQ